MVIGRASSTWRSSDVMVGMLRVGGGRRKQNAEGRGIVSPRPSTLSRGCGSAPSACALLRRLLGSALLCRRPPSTRLLGGGLGAALLGSRLLRAAFGGTLAHGLLRRACFGRGFLRAAGRLGRAATARLGSRLRSATDRPAATGSTARGVEHIAAGHGGLASRLLAGRMLGRGQRRRRAAARRTGATARRTFCRPAATGRATCPTARWTAATRTAGRPCDDERALFLIIVAVDDRGAQSPFFLIVVRVVGTVPEVVAVVLVGRPAPILFIVLVVRRPAAATAISKIIDVVVAIGESELVVHFVTARHYR